jgi:RNA polymerase sigma factor (sigma-70 family)
LEEITLDNSNTDENLVALIGKTKSIQLFSVIYDRYAGIVYNKCLAFVKNKEEAQDLTHYIFVKIFIKINIFNGKSKFSTWIYSFTYNSCVNYYNREHLKRKDKFVLVDNDSNFPQEHREITDEEIYELKSDRLSKSLELIDPNDKMILFMKYQDDMTIEEMENVLQLGKSAVKMRLSRAKNRLIDIYKTFDYGKSI